ncbi:MAG: hypothetical protein HND44_24155 [Chloroflexi bacterium]|nr:hypothetical protein [Chloroflexota bacterium]NOG37633.1 hypothetical protein [Chloroflexota bacterium]
MSGRQFIEKKGVDGIIHGTFRRDGGSEGGRLVGGGSQGAGRAAKTVTGGEDGHGQRPCPPFTARQTQQQDA